MLIKLGKYVVDSNNKENILKVVKIYLNQYIEIEYIDTVHGGYDRNLQNSNAREIVCDGMYRNYTFFCNYETIDTPYGRYINSEKTVYVKSSQLYSIIKEDEQKCIKLGLLEESGEAESDLSNISLDFLEVNFSINEEWVKKAKESLEKMGVNSDYAAEKLHDIYTSCIHDFYKSGEFDVDAAKYQLIEKGELEKCIEKYNYMSTSYIALKNEEIEDVKNAFWNL